MACKTPVKPTADKKKKTTKTKFKRNDTIIVSCSNTIESEGVSLAVEPWPCPAACTQRGRAVASTEAGLRAQRAQCKGHSPIDQAVTAAWKKAQEKVKS